MTSKEEQSEQTSNLQIPKIEIEVLIAVSDTGIVDTFPKVKSYMPNRRDQWLKEKREDPDRFWAIRTIRTWVELPVSFEEIQ